MASNVKIEKIGEDECIILPKDALERLGWKVGDVVQLHIDDSCIELSKPSRASDEDFDRQMAAARYLMRKYRVALSALAKS